MAAILLLPFFSSRLIYMPMPLYNSSNMSPSPVSQTPNFSETAKTHHHEAIDPQLKATHSARVRPDAISPGLGSPASQPCIPLPTAKEHSFCPSARFFKLLAMHETKRLIGTQPVSRSTRTRHSSAGSSSVGLSADSLGPASDHGFTRRRQRPRPCPPFTVQGFPKI